jgi:hypothetical protein
VANRIVLFSELGESRVRGPFSLAVETKWEKAGRFVITRWQGEKCGWGVPAQDISGDAAVALY